MSRERPRVVVSSRVDPKLSPIWKVGDGPEGTTSPAIVAYAARRGPKLAEFRELCRALGLVSFVVQSDMLDHSEGRTRRLSAWQVCGLENALNLLVADASCVKWHYVFSAAPPHGGTGQCGNDERAAARMKSMRAKADRAMEASTLRLE